jgi:pimeloyl-ACP methyl ester carboxylesterase
LRGGRAEPQGTLILLHAFPLTADMWAPQLALAEHGWRVVAPYLFEPRASGATPESMDDFAGEVIDLLDALHVHEAVFAGLSMGGYVAFAIVRHAARYVRGLVLADTRAEADVPEALDGRKRLLALAREKGPVAVADEMMPKLLSEATRRDRPGIVDHVRKLAAANSTDGVAGAITALMTRPDSTPLLSSLHCPTLIVVGEEDALTPVSQSEEMQRRIGGAELAVIPRAGHLANLEEPAAFNDALARFLDYRV